MQTITIESLTSNEICATRALYQSCLANMGGKNLESLRDDPFTWVAVKDLIKAGWTEAEARGTFSALIDKGIVERYGAETCLNIDTEMDEVFDYLDNK